MYCKSGQTAVQNNIVLYTELDLQRPIYIDKLTDPGLGAETAQSGYLTDEACILSV